MIELANETTDRKPRILVVGIGGAGSNAVDSMEEKGLDGVGFLVINTDTQALARSRTANRLQIGHEITRGLGTGGDPELGLQAARADREEIKHALEGTDLVFITAGLGGGTGTGASPIVAELARELGALTVAITTKPFDFEGAVRGERADDGQKLLREKVDTLITVPNQRLLKVVDERTPLIEAFRVADGVLMQCVQSISDLITQPGLMNLDFSDIRAIMDNTGGAVMGVGFGKGEDRAMQAFQQASSSPLMEEVVIEGAKGILINITGGPNMTLHEISRAIEEQITARADRDANVIFGVVVDPSMEDDLKVTVLATGFQRTVRRPERERIEAQADPEPDFQIEPEPEAEFDFETPAYLSSSKPFRSGERDGGRKSEDMESEERREVIPAIFGNGR